MYSLSFPRRHLRRIVVIVVEDRRHARLEGRIVRDQDHHIAVDASLAVVVPRQDRGQRARRAQIDLHPLRTGPQLDEVAVAADFSPSVIMSSSPMTGCMSLEVTFFFAESRTVPCGDVEGTARFPRDRFEVGALQVGRRADEHRLGQLELQFLLPGRGLGPQRGQSQEEQRRAREECLVMEILEGNVPGARSRGGCLARCMQPVSYHGRPGDEVP